MVAAYSSDGLMNHSTLIRLNINLVSVIKGSSPQHIRECHLTSKTKEEEFNICKQRNTTTGFLADVNFHF